MVLYMAPCGIYIARELVLLDDVARHGVNARLHGSRDSMASRPGEVIIPALDQQQWPIRPSVFLHAGGKLVEKPHITNIVERLDRCRVNHRIHSANVEAAPRCS